jgi:Tfp pilus assembly protein PilP
MVWSSLGTRRIAFVAVVVCAAFLAVACGDDDDDTPYRRPTRDHVRPGQSSIDARKRIKEGGAGLVEKGADGKPSGKIKLPKLAETDFIEGDIHRDPFRPFIEVVRRKETVERVVQREIKLKDFDVSELRLIGIITNIGDPRAMVVTPIGEGIVLRRGDYVGKADFIDQGSGGERIQVNWRVARIHGSGKEEERGIYLVRDDPLTKTPEDVTRFMPLHPRK